jgi:hypothetical protein
MKVFTSLAMFDSLGEALDAEKELRAAGYGTCILDDIDDYSRTVWVDVWRPCEADNHRDPRFGAAWKRLDAIVGPFGGSTDEAGLVDHYEPRDLAFPKAF